MRATTALSPSTPLAKDDGEILSVSRGYGYMGGWWWKRIQSALPSHFSSSDDVTYGASDTSKVRDLDYESGQETIGFRVTFLDRKSELKVSKSIGNRSRMEPTRGHFFHSPVVFLEKAKTTDELRKTRNLVHNYLPPLPIWMDFKTVIET